MLGYTSDLMSHLFVRFINTFTIMIIIILIVLFLKTHSIHFYQWFIGIRCVVKAQWLTGETDFSRQSEVTITLNKNILFIVKL